MEIGDIINIKIKLNDISFNKTYFIINYCYQLYEL